MVVKKVRLSSRVRKGDRITVEADPAEEPKAVYDLVEQVGKGLPLGLYNVTQVELAVTVAGDSGQHREDACGAHHAPEFLLAEVRRTRPQAARHAGGIRHRAQGAAG